MKRVIMIIIIAMLLSLSSNKNSEAITIERLTSSLHALWYSGLAFDGSNFYAVHNNESYCQGACPYSLEKYSIDGTLIYEVGMPSLSDVGVGGGSGRFNAHALEYVDGSLYALDRHKWISYGIRPVNGFRHSSIWLAWTC